MFAGSMNWSYKLLCMLCIHVSPYNLNIQHHAKLLTAGCVYGCTLLTVSVFLPSLIFSVHCRAKTLSCISQTALMFCVCHVLFNSIHSVDVLGMHDTDEGCNSFAPNGMPEPLTVCKAARRKELGIADHYIHMLLLHILASIIQHLTPQHRLLVCQQAAKTTLSIATAFLLFFVFIAVNNDVYSSSTLGFCGLFFVGEICGLCVLFLDRTIQIISLHCAEYWASKL